MKTKKILVISSITIIVLLVAFSIWLPAAAQGKVFPAKVGTIESGKQGLVLSNVPAKVKYVSFETMKPPLPARYSQGVDIAYRGPVVDITFLDTKKEAINYSSATAQVYFNIGVPEKNLWDAGGSDVIAIWHYDEDAKLWQMCPTVLVEEKLNNGKYDRLACFVFQNGIYMLGKMEFDPVFPLLFKPHDKGDPTSSGPAIYQSEVFAAKLGTFEFGKQGIVLNSLPDKVDYVSFSTVKPLLPARYHLGVDIAYRGPVVDISFLNENKAPIAASDLNAQVFFNISTPETKMWETGGREAIAIWHYNTETKKWEACPTFYVPEKSENGQYDRLTCYTSRNGIYMLGKMEFDPVFSLWFKPYDKDVSDTLNSSASWITPD